MTEQAKVLYLFESTTTSSSAEQDAEHDGRLTFIELQRPAYKGNADISKYVSWFQLYQEKEPKILTFEAMDETSRTFAEGTLCFQSEEGSWIGTEKSVTMNESKKVTQLKRLNPDDAEDKVVQACLSVWECC